MDEARQEAGERGGWGAGLTEQITLQIDAKTADILRIMRANTRRTQGDIVREALAGRGLAKVAGYEQAATEYEQGRRVSKAPATGGRRASVRRVRRG